MENNQYIELTEQQIAEREANEVKARREKIMAIIREEFELLKAQYPVERRTTIEAHAILHASGKKQKKHKKNVDAVAASLILQGYLDFKRMQG